nr:protein transport protein SEC31 homolog B-like [Ipomoea batatas]GMD69876.1 protein transport protein SEC31 homolog B-like [Ipomoea batatas]GMD71865.1 protein transport protein SEC31 homolog B-like [Ipomoea batatas]
MWDMRNTMSPVKELTGHTKGVVGMSWCPIDSSYLLTCAKDNRTICWDVVSGEIASELPEGNNWNFDVHWYPKCPGVISASSFDGNIGIYNIEGCGRSGTGDGYFAPELQNGTNEKQEYHLVLEESLFHFTLLASQSQRFTCRMY